jgi:hypothetical protein
VNPNATPADVGSAITGNATLGVVGDAGSGSPNQLLFTGFIGATPDQQPPVSSFTVSCEGLICTLDGRSSSDDIGIVTFVWDLGRFPDPRATGAIVGVAYPHEGPRTVTLTVTDGAGLTSSTNLRSGRAEPATDGLVHGVVQRADVPIRQQRVARRHRHYDAKLEFWRRVNIE